MSAQAHLVGKVTDALSLTSVINGKGKKDVVSNFSLSCRDGFQFEFIECTIWGEAAQSLLERTKKGTLIEVIGRIKNSEWVDKVTQLKNKKTYVLVDRFEILDDRPPLQEKLNV